MAGSSSSDSQNDVSEDEYEVEYISGARWNATFWEYEVHWYMYPSNSDTWEPEENLTKYGSAGLVDRFWKEWRGKRYSRPPVGTQYRAGPEVLVDERRRFLAARPRNKPVKGVQRPKKKSNRIVLEGDRESDEDDEDILESTDSDEDILHSSSSDNVPLDNSRSKSRHSRSSENAAAGPYSRAGSSSARKLTKNQKPSATRPKVSHPILPTPQTTRSAYPAPKVKATKIAREPIVHTRRGRASVREEMHAGSISKDFGGIGAKGKQVERAGEVMALGRRGSGSSGPAPAPKPAYAGISMRKAGQPPNINTTRTVGGDAGPSRIRSRTPVDSPMQISPVDARQGQELRPAKLVDDFVNSIQATIGPEPSSPRNSLFDGPSDDEENQEIPRPPSPPQDHFEPSLADVNMDFDRPMMDSPQVSMTAISEEPQDLPHPDAFSGHRRANSPSLVLTGPPIAPIPAPPSVDDIPPLQPDQWHWTGEFYVMTQESVSAADGDGGDAKTKATKNRVGEVIIRDLAIPDEGMTKRFTSTFEKLMKGKIDVHNTSDLHILYGELGARAFELAQAAWMILSDTDANADADLWRGILRKMEITMQGTIVKIYNASGDALSDHLLLVPCSLVRKFRRLPAFVPVAEHFRPRTTGFAVFMCRRAYNAAGPKPPRPLLAQHLPKYWQTIPPELGEQLRDIKCLVFPNPEADLESGLLHAELNKYNAVVLDGIDTTGRADIIFVHRAWVGWLCRLLGLTDRRKRTYRRFYVYGSGGLWPAAEWDIQEIWIIGGMVTFTPAALLEDPFVVSRVVKTIQSNARWHAYIEPKTIGMLTLGKPDDILNFALERILGDIAFSHDFAPCALALTSPPGRTFDEQFEWMHAQLARAEQSSEELRKNCEQEVICDYEQELKEAPQETKEPPAKKSPTKEPETNGGGWGSNTNNTTGGGWGDDTGGGSGWGDSSGGWGDTTNGWASPAQNADGWGASPPPNSPSPANDQAPAPAPAPSQIDLSQIANDARVNARSEAVIEGLKTMQIQPCFMREIRRFVVIDSAARVKEVKHSKVEVEILTADQFLADFAING